MNKENNVVDLNKFRIVRKLNKTKEISENDQYQDPGERIKRIRETLRRINALMKEANIQAPQNVRLSFQDQ